ncbi:MAG: TULIP family P47-like protein [Acidobacteriota bacterium]
MNAQDPALAPAPGIPLEQRTEQTGDKPQGEISTFGWDTAFAVRIENVNAAIKARKASPTSFSYQNPEDSKITCAGTFGDWQIVRGGDGGGVNVMLPISDVKGVAKGGSGYTPYTWSGGSMTFTIRLHFFDAGDTKRHLRVQPTAGGPSEPVVQYFGGDYSQPLDPPWTMYAMQAAVTAWCKEHLADFAYIFSIADLNDSADKKAWAFLKPTTLSYSYVDGETEHDAFLGVLAMTQGESAGNLQQVIDKRIVQGDEEGAFCISRDLLLKRLILPNLQQLWTNLKTDQVTFGEQGFQLKANESVDLPQTTYQGNQYTPQLKRFSFVIEGPQITLEAYTETQVQSGVTAWCQTTNHYTIKKGTNSKGETTLAYAKLPSPPASHGHHIATWVKITDDLLALVLGIALAALAILTGGAAVPVIAVLGALLVGLIALSPTISGMIENNDAPAINLLQDNISNPMVWTDSKDFQIDVVDLDGAIRLGGSLGFGSA